MNKYQTVFYQITLFSISILGCRNTPKGWVSPFPAEGTNASLRAADLNADGILDFVIGGGRNLHEKSEEGVLALNGRTGEVLWAIPVEDQIFGSATFLDITRDGIPEVFIGGRKSIFLAIDGCKGTVLWRYKIPTDTVGPLKTAHYNFYNAQLVADQNADGLADLLVSNGGNVKVAPHVSKGREAGVLLLLDSKNGDVLAAAAMPDGKETYMSPVVCDINHSGQLSIFFGTGGETIGGSFYRAQWPQFMAGDLSLAKKLATDSTHGFVAPPTVTDLNEDGILDVAVTCHNTSIYAFDGRTDSLIWNLKVPNTEANSSLAPGFFNDDKIPDFFLYYVKGAWPENSGACQMAIDGKNGRVLREYTIGCTGFSSPVTFDFDGDGHDEAVVNVNEFECATQNFTQVKSRYVVFDVHRDSVWQLGEQVAFKNLSTTPWIGDADGNGLLDLVFCVQMNTSYVINFNGMIISLLPTPFTLKKPPTWGAYMGNRGDGLLDAGKDHIR